MSGKRLPAVLFWYPLRVVAHVLLGAVVVLVAGGILYLESQPDLQPWHRVALDEEFRAGGPVTDFAGYLALEERLFAELDEEVYGVVPDRRGPVNRYVRDSLADPRRWPVDWNRTFELPASRPSAGVLLLHGMSDSPYSLRALGVRLQTQDAWVLGLRLPGHGTAPAGLVDATWQDMAAATALAVRHLATQVGDRPIYLVGYSNGAALAVHYALASLEGTNDPVVRGLVLLSPAIGVAPMAALAVWQARLGRLLGLEKLAWNGIQAEYDPFKYGSFAVNAGDQVYQLTREIQRQLRAARKRGDLERLPPILAFQSVVDATVSTPALVTGLFDQLPVGGHELVLFDVNRHAVVESLLKGDPTAVLRRLLAGRERPFTLTAIGNRDEASLDAVERRSLAPGGATSERDLALRWPADVYSLSHVGLPFSARDPLYGSAPDPDSGRVHLGVLALRGERGVLQVSAKDMLRLRFNPFLPYLEERVLEFLGLPPDGSAPAPPHGSAAPGARSYGPPGSGRGTSPRPNRADRIAISETLH